MSTPNTTKTSPRLTIRVTQGVIDGAEQRDSSHCMIADAIQAAVPNAKYISVDLATIRFTDLLAGKRYIYLTPRPAQEALLAFDQGEKTEPFTVRLQTAHVLSTGSARKARASLEPKDYGTNSAVPERREGKSPPLGPLAAGALISRKGVKGRSPLAGAGAGNRTGRRREFGLRAIIR